MSEKTHQPTEKKLRDAQKKGQVPRSKLFTSAAVTLGGLENRPGLSLLTLKVSACVKSASPSSMLVAQLLMLCAPLIPGAMT